jgi:hypothetical protein
MEALAESRWFNPSPYKPGGSAAQTERVDVTAKTPASPTTGKQAPSRIGTVVTVETEGRVAAFKVVTSVTPNGDIEFQTSKLTSFLESLEPVAMCSLCVAGSDAITAAFAHLIARCCKLEKMSLLETRVGVLYKYATCQNAESLLLGVQRLASESSSF